MLKTITDVSPQLAAFLLTLRLSLSRPQQRHVMQVADALITTEGSLKLPDWRQLQAQHVTRPRAPSPRAVISSR